MLTTSRLEHILDRLPTLIIGVVGDLFLDRYLDIDATLSETSIETGLEAYQVVGVRSDPGAAGTVLNNLAALGVGRIRCVSVLGDDGEGYELRQALRRMPTIDTGTVFTDARRRTPTYTKPMLRRPGRPPEELNRLDIKNRAPLPPDTEERVLDALSDLWSGTDAILVLDQVSEPDCGVVTARVRERLARLGDLQPDRLVLADSRERIGMFRSVWLKPNDRECVRAGNPQTGLTRVGFSRLIVDPGIEALGRRSGRPVFCTCGERGMLVFDPREDTPSIRPVPAFPVAEPIDIVGAGDSASAGLAGALAAGATLTEAAAFANLVASITIRQLGTTGTASPEQIRRRWVEVQGEAAGSAT